MNKRSSLLDIGTNLINSYEHDVFRVNKNVKELSNFESIKFGFEFQQCNQFFLFKGLTLREHIHQQVSTHF